VTLTLITDTRVAIPSCLLIYVTHTPSLVSIGQSNLKLLSENWISIFRNSDLDLDHRHLGSNPKLPLDISHPYSKFCVNRPKQTKVIERKPKVDARPPAHRRLQHYNNPVFVENLVNKIGKTEWRCLCIALLLNEIELRTGFLVDILCSFRVPDNVQSVKNKQRTITPKLGNAELYFLCTYFHSMRSIYLQRFLLIPLVVQVMSWTRCGWTDIH